MIEALADDLNTAGVVKILDDLTKEKSADFAENLLGSLRFLGFFEDLQELAAMSIGGANISAWGRIPMDPSQLIERGLREVILCQNRDDNETAARLIAQIERAGVSAKPTPSGGFLYTLSGGFNREILIDLFPRMSGSNITFQIQRGHGIARHRKKIG